MDGNKCKDLLTAMLRVPHCPFGVSTFMPLGFSLAKSNSLREALRAASGVGHEKAGIIEHPLSDSTHTSANILLKIAVFGRLQQ